MLDPFTFIADGIVWHDDQVVLRGTNQTPDAFPLHPTTALHADSLARLAEFLYAHYYAFDHTLFRGSLDHPLSGLRRRSGDLAFIECLKASNPCTGYKSHNWTVVGTEGAHGLFVERDGIVLFVKKGHQVADCEHSAGDVIAVRFPGESTSGMSGFYVCFGDSGPVSHSRCTRLYLNLVAECAPTTLGLLCAALRDHAMAYTIKIVNAPAQFARRDNTVLYIEPEHYARAIRSVLDVKSRSPRAFGNTEPSLTFRLSSGISAADNPAPRGEAGSTIEHTSFGMHRMQLLATGISSGVAKGVRAREELASLMRLAFHDAGVDPERPYLSSKDSVDYFSHSQTRTCRG